MAAGLGFKNFNTGEVLTSADVNGYLMQGVLVFASEAARDAAITSPQEGQFAYTKDNNSLWYYTGSAWAASGATGDIEGVTAGTGISGGGTSGTVTITNSMATEIDAKGDLIVGTGADTFARLAVGTNGHTLVADSVETTGLKWVAPAAGGGMTLLDTMTLSGASTTSTTFSSAYTALVIYIKGAQNSQNTELRLRLNGDTGNNYAWIFINNAVEAATSAGTSYARIGNIGTNSAALQNSTQIINLMRPSDTDQVFITTTAQYFQSTIQNFHCTGVYDNSAAITSITLIPGGGTMSAGTVLIYGAN